MVVKEAEESCRGGELSRRDTEILVGASELGRQLTGSDSRTTTILLLDTPPPPARPLALVKQFFIAMCRIHHCVGNFVVYATVHQP